MDYLKTPVEMSHLVNIHTHFFHADHSIQILSVDYQLFQNELTKPEIPNHFFSLAFHPMMYDHSEQLNAELFNSLATNQKVQAIGEIGLDKNSKLAIDDQVKVFGLLNQLSLENQLPIVIHCVGKWNELELLLKTRKENNPACIIHGFRKTKLGNKFLALGAKLSFGAALLYDEQLQEFVKTVPLDQLFLETDEAEVEIRQLYEKLAELKCLPLPSIITQLYSNYLAVFRHE